MSRKSIKEIYENLRNLPYQDEFKNLGCEIMKTVDGWKICANDDLQTTFTLHGNGYLRMSQVVGFNLAEFKLKWKPPQNLGKYASLEEQVLQTIDQITKRKKAKKLTYAHPKGIDYWIHELAPKDPVSVLDSLFFLKSGMNKWEGQGHNITWISMGGNSHMIMCAGPWFEVKVTVNETTLLAATALIAQQIAKGSADKQDRYSKNIQLGWVGQAILANNPNPSVSKSQVLWTKEYPSYFDGGILDGKAVDGNILKDFLVKNQDSIYRAEFTNFGKKLHIPELDFTYLFSKKII